MKECATSGILKSWSAEASTKNIQRSGRNSATKFFAWETFKHSCGAIESFVEPLIDSGFDILNPVQCSATGMDPQTLKDRYGDRIVFWGGGVDTQQTLPFGKPEQVREEVLERCRLFSPNGGFVFNSIHNVQALTPTANMVALLDAYREFMIAGR